MSFRFDTAWPAELEPDRTAVEAESLRGGSRMLPTLPVFLEFGADRERISHTVNLAQRHDDSPLWETSVLPEKFLGGRLPGDFKFQVGPGEPEGLLHMVQHYRLPVGERIQVVCAAGLSAQAAKASFEGTRSISAVAESESAWRRYFTTVPHFTSSDPWLTTAYWYRWYGLRLNTVDMPDLPIRGTTFQVVSPSGFQPESRQDQNGPATHPLEAPATAAPLDSGTTFQVVGPSGFQPESGQDQDGPETHPLEARATIIAPRPLSNADDEPLVIRQGANLPHWTRTGATYAVRFRLADAVPSSVREEWLAEREWLKRASAIGKLSAAQRLERERLYADKIERYLDSGQGSCCLREPAVAELVRSAIEHFDGERYRIHAWCVMPNHVHAVVEPLGEHSLSQTLHSWKSFTSNQINQFLGRQGQLWQEESYDHLIRNVKDFEAQVAHVIANPAKAKLKDWQWKGYGVDSGTTFQVVSPPGFQPESGQDQVVSPSGFQPESGQDQDGPDTHGLEGHATFSPFVTEGVGFFRNFVTYSAQAHLREVSWMHDPRLAVGILENLAKCQRADGSFPGHNYSCRPSRDFYHADFATGLRQLEYLHGPQDKPLSSMERYADYLLTKRGHLFETPIHHGLQMLILVFDQNETGQEYMSRYTAVSADADQWASFAVCGVDASTYALSLLRYLSFRFRDTQKTCRKYANLAGQVRNGLEEVSWDEQGKFFHDVLPNGERTPAHPATGLYPLACGDAFLMWHNGGRALDDAIWEWLHNPDAFDHERGFSADSALDPSFSADAEWKDKRLNCPWNGRSWPMVNSHLVDAAAAFARTYKHELGNCPPYFDQARARCVKAGEALMKVIRLMFHDGDPRRPNSYEHYNPITGMPALYRGYDDYMHSWIVDLMLRHAVGVIPGRDTVEPLPLDVDWIECRDIPHPRGRMHVRIERGAEPQVEIEERPN